MQSSCILISSLLASGLYLLLTLYHVTRILFLNENSGHDTSNLEILHGFPLFIELNLDSLVRQSKFLTSKPSLTSSASPLGSCNPHTSSPCPPICYLPAMVEGPPGPPMTLLLIVSVWAAECLKAWILEPKRLGPTSPTSLLSCVNLEKLLNFSVPILHICKMGI